MFVWKFDVGAAVWTDTAICCSLLNVVLYSVSDRPSGELSRGSWGPFGCAPAER